MLNIERNFSNLLNEKYIVGTLIMMPEQRDKIILSLDEKHFAFEGCRELFSICRLLIANNVEPELPVIINELAAKGIDINPHELGDYTNYYTFNTEYFIQKILDDYRLSFYENKLNGSLSKEFSKDDVIPEKIENYIEQVLTEGLSERKINPARTLDFKKAIEELETDSPAGISTGYKMIDEYITALHNGDLIVLGGWTGQGKTSLALNIANNLIKNNLNVGFISLEMDAKKITDRFMAMTAGVDLTKITGKTLTVEDWGRLRDAFGELREYENHFYLSEGRGKLKDVLTQMRKFKDETNCSLIIIDYLGLIENPEVKHSRYMEICSITRAIKLAAMNLNVPVLLLSQLSRPLKMAKNPEPQLGDLRDSGSIEQDSDVVLMVYRSNAADDACRTIKIAKGRNVRTGKINLRFEGKYTRFVETK